MWNDEDNNPYGSFQRRDSSTSETGHQASPATRYNQTSTPPSGGSSPSNEPSDFSLPAPRVREDEGGHEQESSAPKRKASYKTRLETILEQSDLVIEITHAGKNQEGGGNFIAYSIRTAEVEARRRYSDFYSLRQALVNLHPTLIIPPIPEKHSMADYAAKPTKAKEDEAIIDYRKRMLTSFLNRCRRMKDVREDGVFWKFLDPNASWSEVLHSPPVSTLPKNNLKAPPLDPANPTPGHNFLPIPSSTAKLKSVGSSTTSASGTPNSPSRFSVLPSTAAHTTPGIQTFGRFPPSSRDMSEQDLDPYFVNFENSSKELEALLQGSMEKVNRRILSHFGSFSEDLAELGARFNGFSLSEKSTTLATAIEKVGQAVDNTYMATGDFSSSLGSTFSEPMRESAQFAGIVRSVLRYRILKRVQEEMTKEELERKKAHLEQLEGSEAAAQQIDKYLETTGYSGSQLPKRSSSTASNRSSHERSRSEEDVASVDSDFPQGTDNYQSTTTAASPPHTPKKSSRNSVTGKIFGRINYAIHGIVDVDPERTRRDQIGKTKESLSQLEQALHVSEKDVKDASAGVLKSLKSFQSEKEDDMRKYMIAYARCHVAWAKRNLASWEEAKAEVDNIDEPSKYLELPFTRQLLFITSAPKKRKTATYSKKGPSSLLRQDNAIFLEEDNHSVSPPISPHPRYIPAHLTGEVMPAEDTLGQTDGSSPLSVSNPDLDSTRFQPARSSSPAKRSASERDGDEVADSQMDVDIPERHVRSPRKIATQTSSLPSRIKSIDGTGEESPMEEEHSQTDDQAPARNQAMPSFDEQARIVRELTNNTQLTEGTKGYIISSQWFTRVLARTTQGMTEGFPKASREGPVGPLDNTDIAITSGMADLKDEAGELFIPLNPEMRMHDDFEIIPFQAWDLIKRWHGVAEGSPVITRYVHNTSERGASQQNLMYEVHPPMITIQKLRNDAEGMSQDSLRNRDKPAVRLVASRHDQYQAFLKRAKTVAGIPMSTKVQVWKILDTSSPDEFTSAVPTPVVSHEPLFDAADAEPSALPKLVIDFATFASMAEGVKRELLNFKDETANEKYNGHTNLATVGFSETQSLILEEQVRPDGDEQYVSDKIQRTAKENGVEISPSKEKKAAAQDKLKPQISGTITRGRSHGNGKTKGTVGFQNLGNTCYMNSALQCIRSIEELTIYFLAEKYKTEINSDNPLGYNGSMAKSYASLVHSVYETTQSFSPRSFKNTLGRCQPLFSSYGQQDSQEFLSFLVDALHEDLNRIHKKPYIENPDSDDNTVHDPEAIKQLGETYRTNHRARNDSIATDLFTGFYKNTMVCPVCKKVSVTFDPYSSLTLQLPIENTWQHIVTLWPVRGAPVQVHVDIDKNSNIRMVKEYVAKRVKGVKPEALVVAEVYSDKFYKIFEDAEVVAELSIAQNDRIDFYELDETPTNWPPLDKGKPKKSFLYSSKSEELPSLDSPVADRMAIPIVHRKKNLDSKSPFVLYPSFILVTREEAQDYDAIHRKVLRRVSTMTTKDIFQPQEGEQQHEEADTVLMTEGDTSDDAQVQARSVEGEDELVDISMPDKTDAIGSVDGLMPGGSSKPSATERGFNDILNPNYFLTPELSTLFDMKVLSSTTDIIPLSYSQLSETSKYPLLATRLTHQLEARGPSAGLQRPRSVVTDRRSPASSDDELSLPNINNVGRVVASDSESDGSRVSDTRQPRTNIVSKFSRIGKKGVSFSKNRRTKKQQAEERGDREYLLRLGDGLVIDWNEEGYDQLFGGDEKDDFRGRFSLDIITTVPDSELDLKKARRSARRQNGVTIEECFRETTKEEILSEENAWYCGRCKELRRASKTLEIWTIPDILVLHLKRFSTNSRLRDKIDVLVDFPITDLDLSGKVGLTEDKSLHYDLFAVDNHYGGLGGGHYTAVAQNFYDKKWYDYNDSSVSEVRPEQAVTKAAYLLFYRRRSSNPLGPPNLQDIVKSHYAPSSEQEPAGEGERPDDSASRNGSSSDSPPAAVGALRLPGSPAGRGLASQARSESRDLLRSGYESDEAIDMGMDNDIDAHSNAMESFGPGNLTRDAYNNVEPSWNWDNVPVGASARHSSDNEMADSDTLPGDASDAPAMGSEGGASLRDRLEEDFGDESRLNSYGPPTPESDTGVAVRYLENVQTREHSDDDGEVAEVRLDEDEGV